jgi:DoxX
MGQDANFLATWTPRMLSILRIVVAGLFLQHGTAKLLHVPHIASMDNVQLVSLIGLAGVLEIVGGILLPDRPFHAPGRVHPFRGNGIRVFHRARAQSPTADS